MSNGIVRFRFAPAKVEALLLQYLEHGPTRIAQILATFYLADKAHLNAWGRPITGSRYEARKLGPFPIEIYEMLTSSPYWLEELNRDHFRWTIEGAFIARTDSDDVSMSETSQSDRETFADAFSDSLRLKYDGRDALLHQEDWQRANGGEIDYADMLADHPNRDDRIAEMRDLSRYIKI